ncbi:MAG: hypothetical protein JEY91_08440, partial [Spirochaetaceae bacterium]|nr:hypothetical protein [Spirochaetaceae bacterium]
MKDKNENSINFQTPLNVVIMVVALLILPQTLLARGARDMDIDDWEQQSEQVREENRLGEESGDGEMLREEVREENRLGEESGDGEMLREEV